MTEYYLFWLVLWLLCWVAAEKGCVNSFYGITEDVRFKICCPKLKCWDCSIPYGIFSSKWPLVSGVHDVNFGHVCIVSWITEWCLVFWVYIGIWKYQCEEVQMVLDGSKQLVTKEWCMSFDLWSHSFCPCFFKGEKVLLLCNWLWRCTHVLVVLCEVAIVIQSKAINLFRDAATGPILSLTINHMC